MLLNRNLNHTAQLSLSARGGGELIILSVGLGGGNSGKDPIFQMIKRSEIFNALNVRRNGNFAEFAQFIFILGESVR